MINKQKLPLYIALAIPVLMILLVAAFIYLPGLGSSPKYNFIYMTGNNVYSYGQQQYVVSGGHLVKTSPPQQNYYGYPAPTPTPTPDNTLVHFYLYDVSQGTSQEISFDQAAAYHLDSSNSSPDNYVIERGNGGGGGGFLFGSPSYDYNSWFIKGHNRSNKLNLKLTGTSYDYYNFQFLGWIE